MVFGHNYYKKDSQLAKEYFQTTDGKKKKKKKKKKKSCIGRK